MLGASCRIDIATCQPYHTVDEHCVGVLGLGGMGTPIARLFADLGFEIAGWSRTRRKVDKVTCLAGLDELPQLLGCPSSKHLGHVILFPKGGSGSSRFDVMPLGVDGSSGAFGWLFS